MNLRGRHSGETLLLAAVEGAPRSAWQRTSGTGHLPDGKRSGAELVSANSQVSTAIGGHLRWLVLGSVVTYSAGRRRLPSPDGRGWAWARQGRAVARQRLLVGPAGGKAAVVAERVGQFWFAPDGRAVAALSSYDEKRSWGRLTYADLPDGKPTLSGRG